jgi:hypothetical protein
MSEMASLAFVDLIGIPEHQDKQLEPNPQTYEAM